MREPLKAFYRTYTNDFLSIGAYADHHHLSDEHTAVLVDIGRELHEEDVARGSSSIVEQATLPVATKIVAQKMVEERAELPLYGYVCFYNGKRHELRATSKMAAITAAVAYFKPPKSKAHMVSVVLAERPDGTEVVHSTASL